MAERKFDFDMVEWLESLTYLTIQYGRSDQLEALRQVMDFIGRVPREVVDEYRRDFISIEGAVKVLNEANHGGVDEWAVSPRDDGGTDVAYTYPGGYHYALSEGQAILVAEGILRSKEAANG